MIQIPRPQNDKLLHFFYGFIIYFSANIFLNEWKSFIIVCIIAIAKETRDKVTKKGTPEIMDILYTITTGLLLFLKSIIIK